MKKYILLTTLTTLTTLPICSLVISCKENLTPTQNTTDEKVEVLPMKLENVIENLKVVAQEELKQWLISEKIDVVEMFYQKTDYYVSKTYDGMIKEITFNIDCYYTYRSKADGSIKEIAPFTKVIKIKEENLNKLYLNGIIE